MSKTGVIHEQASPLAGKSVKLKSGIREIGGADYRVEDWWDRVSGGSWMWAEGNPACLMYAFRSGSSGIPLDDEVLYGKIGHLGYLVHISEIEGEAGE